METKEKNFNEFTPTTRTLFFNNCSVVVSSNGLEITEGRNDNKVIPHNFSKLAPAFHMQGDRLMIDNIDSKVFRFLINSSRINWRAELETGDEVADAEYFAQNRFTPYGSRLTADQQQEQVANLMIKIYTYGYLLHNFKDDTAKCVLLANKDAHLCCLGKSLFMRILHYLQLANIVTLDGRYGDITENNHFLNRVSSNTDILFVDDATKNFPIETFYGKITGQLTINPKGSQSFEIDNLFPVISSIYLPHTIGRYMHRRLIPVLFSDYYHIKEVFDDTCKYRETRCVSNDCGKILFGREYSEREYNADYNFMINCLQFYLSHQDFFEMWTMFLNQYHSK